MLANVYDANDANPLICEWPGMDFVNMISVKKCFKFINRFIFLSFLAKMISIYYYFLVVFFFVCDVIHVTQIADWWWWTNFFRLSHTIKEEPKKKTFRHEWWKIQWITRSDLSISINSNRQTLTGSKIVLIDECTISCDNC